MSKKGFNAVVAGHVCLDVIPDFQDTGVRDMSRLMVPGSLVSVGAAAVSTGGPVSNTGLALVRLGIRTGLMAKIGNDFFGSGVISVLEKHDAADALTIVEGERTAYTLVLAPPGIDRIFMHHPGANDTFGSGDINYDIVASSRLFHLGYPPLMKRLFANNGQETVEIFKRVKGLGVTTSLDLALPDPNSESGKADWNRILGAVLPYVDIAPFSAEEVMYMLDRRRFDELRKKAGTGDPLDVYGSDDFRWIGRRLLELGAKIVVVKCGHRGMLLFSAGLEAIRRMGSAAPARPELWADCQLWSEAFHIDRVASATGSGDSSIAGFLAAFLVGLGPEQALEVGCCVGAQNVLELDALSGIHTWEETLAMIPGWHKARQDPGTGWTYDDTDRIWRATTKD